MMKTKHSQKSTQSDSDWFAAQTQTGRPTPPVAYQAELRRLIQEEAYLLAEIDNFTQPSDFYWLAAEKKVCDRF